MLSLSLLAAATAQSPPDSSDPIRKLTEASKSSPDRRYHLTTEVLRSSSSEPVHLLKVRKFLADDAIRVGPLIEADGANIPLVWELRSSFFLNGSPQSLATSFQDTEKGLTDVSRRLDFAGKSDKLGDSIKISLNEILPGNSSGIIPAFFLLGKNGSETTSGVSDQLEKKVSAKLSALAAAYNEVHSLTESVANFTKGSSNEEGLESISKGLGLGSQHLSPELTPTQRREVLLSAIISRRRSPLGTDNTWLGQLAIQGLSYLENKGKVQQGTTDETVRIAQMLLFAKVIWDGITADTKLYRFVPVYSSLCKNPKHKNCSILAVRESNVFRGDGPRSIFVWVPLVKTQPKPKFEIKDRNPIKEMKGSVASIPVNLQSDNESFGGKIELIQERFVPESWSVVIEGQKTSALATYIPSEGAFRLNTAQSEIDKILEHQGFLKPVLTTIDEQGAEYTVRLPLFLRDQSQSWSVVNASPGRPSEPGTPARIRYGEKPTERVKLRCTSGEKKITSVRLVREYANGQNQEIYKLGTAKGKDLSLPDTAEFDHAEKIILPNIGAELINFEMQNTAPEADFRFLLSSGEHIVAEVPVQLVSSKSPVIDVAMSTSRISYEKGVGLRAPHIMYRFEEDETFVRANVLSSDEKFARADYQVGLNRFHPDRLGSLKVRDSEWRPATMRLLPEVGRSEQVSAIFTQRRIKIERQTFKTSGSVALSSDKCELLFSLPPGLGERIKKKELSLMIYADNDYLAEPIIVFKSDRERDFQSTKLTSYGIRCLLDKEVIDELEDQSTLSYAFSEKLDWPSGKILARTLPLPLHSPGSGERRHQLLLAPFFNKFRVQLQGDQLLLRCEEDSDYYLENIERVGHSKKRDASVELGPLEKSSRVLRLGKRSRLHFWLRGHPVPVLWRGVVQEPPPLTESLIETEPEP